MSPVVVDSSMAAPLPEGARSTPRPEMLLPSRVRLPLWVPTRIAELLPLASRNNARNEPLAVLITLLSAARRTLPAVLAMLMALPLPEVIRPSEGVVPPELLPSTVMSPSLSRLIEAPAPVTLSTVP